MKKDRIVIKSLLLVIFHSFFSIINVYAKKIEVESFDVLEKSDTISVEELNYTNDTVSSNIKFNKQNDYLIFGIN